MKRPRRNIHLEGFILLRGPCFCSIPVAQQLLEMFGIVSPSFNFAFEMLTCGQDVEKQTQIAVLQYCIAVQSTQVYFQVVHAGITWETREPRFNTVFSWYFQRIHCKQVVFVVLCCFIQFLRYQTVKDSPGHCHELVLPFPPHSCDNGVLCNVMFGSQLQGQI